VDAEALIGPLGEHIAREILLRNELLDPDEDIFDAGFDSMSLSRLLVFVEDRYGVVIPDEEVIIDEITTVRRMARFFARYVEAG